MAKGANALQLIGRLRVCVCVRVLLTIARVAVAVVVGLKWVF